MPLDADHSIMKELRIFISDNRIKTVPLTGWNSGTHTLQGTFLKTDVKRIAKWLKENDSNDVNITFTRT